MNRLRLLGFKSFTDPTELVIEKGLTGVVGPNGCGKSNLLEALRWVMGETSHKSMRAAAMDDVIFSGTNTRPARNWAEVTIFLDNSARTAPAEFNDTDTVEITRRIEREAGSAYRINGRDARARDVKLLFEDAATGARSPALVRQGQIAEIVNAKPEQRRRVLEDAAGVAGLHSRRHEAELRLKAAEGNLARLGDIIGQLSSQLESLKRQARQAKRYKELSTEIRRAEALLLHLLWTEAQTQVDSEEAALLAALSALGTATQAEAAATRLEAELSSQIQPLREAEATRGAILARLKIEQNNFEAEARRSADRERELKARHQQLATDLSREQHLVDEARETLTRLEAEHAKLAAVDIDADGQDTANIDKLDAAEAALAKADRDYATLSQKAHEITARRRSLESNLAAAREQSAKISRQIAALDTQIREIMAKAPDAQHLTRIQEAAAALATHVTQIEGQTIEAESNVRKAASVAKTRGDESRAATLAASEVRTELSTLAKLLVPVRDDDIPPIVDKLRVAKGYEVALGAALGDDLDAPIQSDYPVHWRRVDPAADDAGLPEGAEPLFNRVKGPPELTRRLRQIGVVARNAGHRLQPSLKAGQRLVSREGDLWRWDGFVAAADAPTAAAQRLAQRNRLADLEMQAAGVLSAADDATADEKVAADLHTAAEAEDRRLRQLWRDTTAELARTRQQLTEIERTARETEQRLQAANEAKERAEEAMMEASEKLLEIETALEIIDGDEDLAPQVTAAQTTATGLRTKVAEIKAEIVSLERERNARSSRLGTITTEQQRWTTRAAAAGQQIAALEERKEEAADELATLADMPIMIEEQREKLLSGIAQAEHERQAAANALGAAENALRDTVQNMRAAQAAVSNERENRARVEARLENARTRRQDEARKIRESLDCAPEGCLPLAQLEPDAKIAPIAEVDRQLTRLKSDRDRLGGVNLQADDELQAIQTQVDGMDAEKRDVEEAINKLRGAIGQLNREAKKRLMEAFEVVNGHFQRLFTTLFGGGEARLEMLENPDDPLQGGLEIIAKPPGKKPATLSLLSGGEQTLTAMSLIFAVFLTNPSPICVLDEVDAPLDDANVDRFCTLLEKMAADTETRFLVITHHPMTMARTDRLFGVTMGEKGVS
ncbi:MAG: chromosome segregation protein SMC, partial [Hyphomicrobiaceae bacterium]